MRRGPSGARTTGWHRRCGGGVWRRTRRHTQPGHLAFGAVSDRRIQRPLPAGLQRLHQATRREQRDLSADCGRQRQAAGNLRQRRQVQPVSLEISLRRLAAPAVGVFQGQIAAGPLQAVHHGEAQGLRAELETVGALHAANPPGHLGKGQRVQLGTQTNSHILQRHIGGPPGHTSFADVSPAAQRTTAALKIQRQRAQCLQLDKLAQAGQVRVAKVSKHLARPGRKITRRAVEKRLTKHAAGRETRPPLRWWRGIEPHRVARGGVAHHQVHGGQRQRRRAQTLVSPAHLSATHHQLGLRKKPVGRPAVAGTAVHTGGNIQTAQVNLAVSSAAKVKLGLFNHQLFKPQPQHRPGRQRGQHARQTHRRLALRVQQRDTLQLKRRDHASGPGRDAGDANRHAQRLAGNAFQLRTPFTDSRHNPAMQDQPHDAKRAPDGGQKPHQHARCKRCPAQTAGRLFRLN